MIQVSNGVVEMKNDNEELEDEVIYMCDLTDAVHGVANKLDISIKKLITRLYILTLIVDTLQDNIRGGHNERKK